MVNYREKIETTAESFRKLIIEHGGREIETENFGWDNNRYVSDKFRIAHIEKYYDGKINVLHVTCFPRPWSEDPIFGFDIIVSETKPLAAFCDWSPVFNNKFYDSKYTFQQGYNLPDWAKNIFSVNAISCIPQDDEFEKVCEISIDSFKTYLESLSYDFSYYQDDIKEKQNYYCDQQLQNQRTFNVLKSKLGEERARYFMNTILFPKIP
jgi:phycocyanobilin:ferredoxin oxidoreductase